MPAPFAASACRIAALAASAAASVAWAADADWVVKPRDGEWIPSGEVEIIAKAPGVRFHIDGEPVPASEPFPGVFHALTKLSNGPHLLRVESGEGSEEIRFRSGPEADGDGIRPFVDHPPFRTACTHCHSVSRRGRFRFSGGCQSCHAREQFIGTHSHEPHELASCGMCHDAHGSSEANHLLLAPEQACTQCHN